MKRAKVPSSSVPLGRLTFRLKRRRYHHSQPSRPRRQGLARKEALQQALGGGADPLEGQLLARQREQTLRLQAEFENFRRRSRKEAQEIRQNAGVEIITDLLPVLDNFSRALETPSNSIESLVDGVRMIQTQFLNLLKECGLETVDAVGETFDPKLHEAVTIDTSGENPENQIVEVFQVGYKIKGKLVRPVMVKVARKG